MSVVSVSIAKKNRKSYINIAIMFALMLGVGYLPPIAQITPLGMKVLGVFLGLIYGWCFIDLLWTSVLGIFALGLTGYTTVLGALTEGFSNSAVIIVFICLAFSHCLNVIGVSESVACWLMKSIYRQAVAFVHRDCSRSMGSGYDRRRLCSSLSIVECRRYYC